jgi:hypothetical protein
MRKVVTDPSTQLLLSSNTIEYVVKVPSVMLVIDIMSCNKAHNGIKSCIACDKAMYSASIVLNVTSVCSFEAHAKDNLQNRIT